MIWHGSSGWVQWMKWLSIIMIWLGLLCCGMLKYTWHLTIVWLVLVLWSDAKCISTPYNTTASTISWLWTTISSTVPTHWSHAISYQYQPPPPGNQPSIDCPTWPHHQQQLNMSAYQRGQMQAPTTAFGYPTVVQLYILAMTYHFFYKLFLENV